MVLINLHKTNDSKVLCMTHNGTFHIKQGFFGSHLNMSMMWSNGRTEEWSMSSLHNSHFKKCKQTAIFFSKMGKTQLHF